MIYYYYFGWVALPFVDISLMLMHTITSSDVIALKVMNTCNSLLLSATEYCDWPIDATAPISQTINACM